MENILAGKWRVTEVKGLDMDEIECLGETFFSLDTEQYGEFRFALAEGNIDYRVSEKSGRIIAEFSWEGFFDNHAACGRGFLTNQDDLMIGRLLVHKGLEYAFVCNKVE